MPHCNQHPASPFYQRWHWRRHCRHGSYKVRPDGGPPPLRGRAVRGRGGGRTRAGSAGGAGCGSAALPARGGAAPRQGHLLPVTHLQGHPGRAAPSGYDLGGLGRAGVPRGHPGLSSGGRRHGPAPAAARPQRAARDLHRAVPGPVRHLPRRPRRHLPPAQGGPAGRAGRFGLRGLLAAAPPRRAAGPGRGPVPLHPRDAQLPRRGQGHRRGEGEGALPGDLPRGARGCGEGGAHGRGPGRRLARARLGAGAGAARAVHRALPGREGPAEPRAEPAVHPRDPPRAALRGRPGPAGRRRDHAVPPPARDRAQAQVLPPGHAHLGLPLAGHAQLRLPQVRPPPRVRPP
mmetsp:Transcript_48787/g.83800  ORF Transcript_48787/g.83800 Transcript_48787/m.83800 type:complete len:346 (-) Transcript_48787:280-1317(-)